jgi:hypothetical protein
VDDDRFLRHVSHSPPKLAFPPQAHLRSSKLLRIGAKDDDDAVSAGPRLLILAFIALVKLELKPRGAELARSGNRFAPAYFYSLG